MVMNKGILLLLFIVLNQLSQSQNPLFIPPALSGTSFNLDVQNGVTQFFPGINTPTYGINGPLLAPTLILQKGDWITMHVTNNLTGNGNATTMHWHGLHVPAPADGGPHQVIPQGTTWSPNFQVMNNAGTFWYHPHGDNKTDLHVSKGLAGMILVKDSAEATLTLPRTYGVDDFPVIIQSKCFDILNQIAIATVFDTTMMVNGTLNPYLQVPAQVVRLRLLNGSSDRSYLIGLSNNMNFHLIGTDGGLIDSSLTLNRIRLSNGERAEILLDLASYQNDTIYLMNYGSQLPNGIIGSPQVGMGMSQIPDYNLNPLNGADFNILQIQVTAPTPNAVTTIASSLVQQVPWSQGSINASRTFVLAPEIMGPLNMVEGPFTINGHMFSMDTINLTTYLNNTELWTINNQTNVAHPFHIHDMHFYLMNINGGPVPDYERGKKDVVLVMPMQSVTFITRFEDFANDTLPYMYHCHLLHHEDDGMMGSFVVMDTTGTSGLEQVQNQEFTLYPNPVSEFLTVGFPKNAPSGEILVLNILGETVFKKVILNPDKIILDMKTIPKGIYFIQYKSNQKGTIRRFIKI